MDIVGGEPGSVYVGEIYTLQTMSFRTCFVERKNSQCGLHNPFGATGAHALEELYLEFDVMPAVMRPRLFWAHPLWPKLDSPITDARYSITVNVPGFYTRCEDGSPAPTILPALSSAEKLTIRTAFEAVGFRLRDPTNLQNINGIMHAHANFISQMT